MSGAMRYDSMKSSYNPKCPTRTYKVDNETCSDLWNPIRVEQSIKI